MLTFPRLGPRKLHVKQFEARTGVAWSAASTIADVLKRNGLIAKPPRPRRPLAQGGRVSMLSRRNEEWSIEFQGWFRTGDAVRCDPLAVSNAVNRHLLTARIVLPTIHPKSGRWPKRRPIEQAGPRPIIVCHAA
jgi:hypothetical protein